MATAAAFLITVGAVTFGLATAVWAFHVTQGARAQRAKWRALAEGLETRVERADAVMMAHPGVVLVWEDADPGDGWGSPRVYGSPTALAALLRFADASDAKDTGVAILEGLADYEARDVVGEDTTLRQKLAGLRAEGEAFSLTILGPSNRFLEADGRPAGRRVVVWLSDATIKGLEGSAARGRIEEARHEISKDPIAFFDMLSRAPTPVFRLTSGLKLQWANQAYLDAVECANLDDAVLQNALLDQAVAKQARETLEAGERRDQSRAIIAGGRRRHFAVSTFPISGGVAGVALDMTAVEEARAGLERHVRAQDDALNHMDDGVVVFGADKRVSFHNHAFARLLGVDAGFLDHNPSHGQLLDHLRERRMLPEQADYPAWRAKELARYTAEPGEEPQETWHLPDGRVMRVARLRHPMGGLIMVFGDMTEELTLNGEFNTLNKVQRATLDRLSEGVAAFGSDGRLRLHNAAFEALWDLPSSRLDEGMEFDRVVEALTPLFHDRHAWASVKARITDPNPEARAQTALELRRADGSILMMHSRPLADGGTVLVFDDETAARKLEEALTDRNAALEQADRIKSDFISHVSYQLRAPLQTILGYAELLTLTAAPKLAEKQAEQLGAIHQAGDQLNKLVEDILDVAAIEANALELDLAPLDLAKSLDSVVNLLRSQAERTQVRVTLDAPETVGAIKADEKRIKQVVYNLMLNALKHADAGGHVTVGARREGAQAQIWVEDDGPGIDPDRQARVFDRFHSDSNTGAGLGLTLVREFVEMHGGWVDLVSEPGQGTRVTCHLPVEAVVDDAGEPAGAFRQVSAGLELESPSRRAH